MTRSSHNVFFVSAARLFRRQRLSCTDRRLAQGANNIGATAAVEGTAANVGGAWFRVLLPILVISVAVPACGSDDSGVGYGPLAVIKGSGGDEAGIEPYPISIGLECVTVGDTVLVWHEDQVRWHASPERIEVIDEQDGSTTTLADGDVIEVAGGSLEGDTLPGPDDDAWIVPIDESCEGSVFSVTRVRVVDR